MNQGSALMQTMALRLEVTVVHVFAQTAEPHRKLRRLAAGALPAFAPADVMRLGLRQQRSKAVGGTPTG